jgi:hypothetical protein
MKDEHRSNYPQIVRAFPSNATDAGEAPQAGAQHISIGKKALPHGPDGGGDGVEIFTMTIGEETIDLIPLKNWTQLDAFKWRSRGIFPRTPAGLEVAFDHVKVAGETVSPWDFNACEKLEKAFNDWLALEFRTLGQAQEKAQNHAKQATTQAPNDELVHFKVDLNNPEQPRLNCLEGNETVKVVALNSQGLTALIEQGFLRKPNSLKVGALRNWVELDGQVFRFKEDPSQAEELERVFNERYRISGDPNVPPDVAVFTNPASPSGFDLQFAATPSGVVENFKRHLSEETIHLLQDPERCRVLRKGITAKFAPPDLVFKIKTPDGGERNLDPGAENTVSVSLDDGQTRTIDLSRPVSLLNLGVRELAAILNHPALNRRARLAQVSGSRLREAA